MKLKKNLIVGLAGPAGSGKDTTKDILYDCFLGRSFNSYRFAKPLYDAVEAMFGWSYDELQNREFKESISEYGFSPRVALQTLGTEWGRNLNPNLWAEITKSQIIKSIEARKKFDPYGFSVHVITDVRFENEADILESMNSQDTFSTVLHIEPKGEKFRTTKETNHASEAGILVRPNHFIVQNGFNGLDSYRSDIVKLLNQFPKDTIERP